MQWLQPCARTLPASSQVTRRLCTRCCLLSTVHLLSRPAGAEVRGRKPGSQLEDSLAELDLEHYDDDELADQYTVAKGVFGTGNPGMAYYRSNLEDPYITLPGDSGSDSQEEDTQLQPSDFVIVSARHEDDVSLLEVLSQPH